MNKYDFFHPAANGEGGIYSRAWICDGEPRAAVQIAHGMKEHSGRYDEFATFLAGNGLAVFANDHAGHGRSDMGHRGTFSIKPGGFDYMIEDINSLFDEMAKRCPGVPLVLFGHSMGSILSALYAGRYGQRLSGLILCGTPANDPLINFGILLCKLKVAFANRTAPIKLIGKLTDGVFLKGIENAHTGYEWLTRDVARQQAFANDPLTHFDFSASAYEEMFEGQKNFLSPEWGRSVPDIPVLIIAGANDNCGKCGDGPRHHYKNLVESGHQCVTLTLYDGARHELINELNRAEVMRDVLEWIGQNALPQS